jgi:hypothetical protein
MGTGTSAMSTRSPPQHYLTDKEAAVNWTDVLVALRFASPWVLSLAIIAYVVIQYMKYRKGTESDLYLTSLDTRMQTHEGVCTKIQTDLEVHMRDHQAIVEQQLKVLEGIEQQLVTLNSHQGPLTMRNQRLMIQYQWNWFRDEVITIAENSIHKNGFKGREEVIARKVANAWKMASRDAMASISRLEGVTYQYDQLFNRSFKTILPKVWRAMLPIYAPETRKAGMLEQALDDLDIRVRTFFEQEIASYFTEQEDIDTGYIYKKNNSGEFNSGLRELLSGMGYAEKDSTDEDYPATSQEV